MVKLRQSFVFVLVTAMFFVVTVVASAASLSDTLSAVNDLTGKFTADNSLISNTADPETNHTPAVSNLTISAGGKMILLSGQSIILKPGTRIEAGGYLKAAVNSNGDFALNAQNPVIKEKRKIRPAASEKPQMIVQAESTISPFARKSGRSFHESRNDNENLVAQVTQVAGISSEPSRKIAAVTTQLTGINAKNIARRFSGYLIPKSQKQETIQVLRL